MAGDSRPPLSHLRPTLSTRLRRSFEGKRSRGENGDSHYNGVFAPDPDTLRTAVEQAISSSDFQNALAASIASILKPSIKSALDTIQPVVEAVYAHDVLLRKTHRGVEDMLEKMDTIEEEDEGRGGMSPYEGGLYDIEFKALLEKSNKRTVATLAELSNTVQNNSLKVAGLESVIGQSRESIEYLKSYVQNQLDQQQAEMSRISQILDSQRKAHSNTHSLFSAHANKLEVMSADLEALKGPKDLSEKLDSVSGELNMLRASVDAGHGASSGDFAGIGSKIDSLAAALTTHGASLQEIKEADSSQKVLAALQNSNDSHASHANILEEIHQKAVASPTGNNSSPEIEGSLQEIKTHLTTLREDLASGHTTHNDAVTGLGLKLDNVLATIEDQQSTDPSAEILESLRRANISHDSHATILGELKERSLQPPSSIDQGSDLESINSSLAALKEHVSSGHTLNTESSKDLTAKIDDLHTKFEAQRTSNSTDDILAALQRSNDSHASHSSILDHIKSSIVLPVPAKAHSEVDGHLRTIIETLDLHSASLADIKNATSAASLTHENIGTELGIAISTLSTHTKLLNEIKEDVSAEILTALHDMGQTQASQTTLLTEIREADVSEEILTALHTSIEAHNGHQSDFEKLHGAVKQLDEHNERHGTELGEIKSRTLELGSPSAVSDHGIGSESKIATILSVLDDHKATLVAIKQSSDTALEHHSAHASSLNQITSRSLEPRAASPDIGVWKDVETKIDGLVEALEEQKVTISSIKQSAESSIASHSAHAASLDELKAASDANKGLHDSHSSVLSEIRDGQVSSRDFQNSHSTALLDIKTAHLASQDLHQAHSATLADLIIATGSANESHASHSTILNELKAIPPPPAVDSSSLATLDADLKKVIETLTQHGTALTEIDASTTKPNPGLLSAIEKSHDLLNSHTTILESLKAPASSPHDEVLVNLAAVKDAVDSTRDDIISQSTLIKNLQLETKDSHSGVTTAISALALGGAAGAGAGFFASKKDESDSHPDNNEVLVEIKAVRSLVEGGVALNDKGLEQLKTSTGPVATARGGGEGFVGGAEIAIKDREASFNDEKTLPDVEKAVFPVVVKDKEQDDEITKPSEEPPSIEEVPAIPHDGNGSIGTEELHQTVDIPNEDDLIIGSSVDSVIAGNVSKAISPLDVKETENDVVDTSSESKEVEQLPVSDDTDSPTTQLDEPRDESVVISGSDNIPDEQKPNGIEVIDDGIQEHDKLSKDLEEPTAKATIDTSESKSPEKSLDVGTEEDSASGLLVSGDLESPVKVDSDDAIAVPQEELESTEISKSIDEGPLADSVLQDTLSVEPEASSNNINDASATVAEPVDPELPSKTSPLGDTLVEGDDLVESSTVQNHQERSRSPSPIPKEVSPEEELSTKVGVFHEDEGPVSPGIEPVAAKDALDKVDSFEAGDDLGSHAKEQSLLSANSDLVSDNTADAEQDGIKSAGEEVQSTKEEEAEAIVSASPDIDPAPNSSMEATSKSPVTQPEPVPNFDKDTIEHIRQLSLTPKEDSDDDMVVEWSGKDEQDDNDASTVFETAVDEPYTAKNGISALESSGTTQHMAKDISSQESKIPATLGTGTDEEDVAKESLHEKELGETDLPTVSSQPERLPESEAVEPAKEKVLHAERDNARPDTPVVESADQSEGVDEKQSSLTEIDEPEPSTPVIEQDVTSNTDSSVTEPSDGVTSSALEETADHGLTPPKSDDKLGLAEAEDDKLPETLLVEKSTVDDDEKSSAPALSHEPSDVNGNGDSEVPKSPSLTGVKPTIEDPSDNTLSKDQDLDDKRSLAEPSPQLKPENKEHDDEIEALISSKLSIGDVLQQKDADAIPDGLEDEKVAEQSSPVILPKSEVDDAPEGDGTPGNQASPIMVKELAEITKGTLEILPKGKDEDIPKTMSLDVDAEDVEDRSINTKEASEPKEKSPAEADYFTAPPKSETVKSPTFSLAEETESEPVTPATPGFAASQDLPKDEEVVLSPGGTTTVVGGSGKKGKKGKKAKKGKKEKAKFEMDGEDPQ